MTETMMIPTTAARPQAKKQCDCGGDPHGECCELECLVQPRFFCGQLLADQDLTAMVDWVKAKSALARFRHGWGVVCGLEVHCGTRGSITVSPGYAMDCCGRDIVVCEETSVDLTSCWKRPEDLCVDLGISLNRPRAVRGVPIDATQIPAQPGQNAGDVEFGFIPRKDVQAIDVFIRYSESQSDSRTALARGSCGGVAGCEYTRVHEGAEIYCQHVDDGCKGPDDTSSRWEQEYLASLQKVREEVEGIVGDAKNALTRLAAYVANYPPHTFCFVKEWLCNLQRQEKPNLDTLPQIAFWILQDWRNEYLTKPCRGCGPDTGIRLARVWLWRRGDGHGNGSFATIYVNPYPPFRRLLARDEWPAPPDKINLAPYVWQPVAAAERSLQQMGFTTTRSVINPPNLAALPATEILLASRNAALTIYAIGDPQCDDQRIVCFGRPRTATGEVSNSAATAAPPLDKPTSTPAAGGTPVVTPIPTVTSQPIGPLPLPTPATPAKAESIAPQPQPQPAPTPVPLAPTPQPATNGGTGTPAPAPAPPAPAPQPATNGGTGTPAPAVSELQSLDGIGPKIAERLKASGITSIADLANASPDAVKQAMSDLQVPDTRVAEMISHAKEKVG